MIEVHEKRRLMVNLETVIVRPGNCDETTLPHLLADFKKLIESTTNGQIKVDYQFCEAGKKPVPPEVERPPIKYE